MTAFTSVTIRCDEHGCTDKVEGDPGVELRGLVRKQAAEWGWTCTGQKDYCPEHPQDTRPKMIRVTGHFLVLGGAAHGISGLPLGYEGITGPGRGKCECGLLSEPLPSGWRRRQWHLRHKMEVIRANQE